VESEAGRGSTFYFTLALRAAPAPLSQPPRELEALAGKRVLIVDDNATSRTILELHAAAWGMSYATFAGGEQALAHAAAQGPYDLAIVDMCLPGMDGLALAGALHAAPDFQTLPIVLLTALSRVGQRAAPVTVAAQVTKPVKAHQLARVLINILQPEPGTVRDQAIATSPSDVERMAARYPLRVLLAEDNLVNQKVAIRMLERVGYTPDLAINGNQVLAALARRPYDVVLMDVQMPELDGIEATRRIRQAAHLPQPYIIAMTAHALEGDREHCLRCGMNDYLSKPVRLESLIFVLQRAYAQRSDSAAWIAD
jgi:CheY-like chemotaxis protein